MKRFTMYGILALTVMGFAGVATAQPPVARFDDNVPGLQMLFDDGTSDITGWGQKQNWSDSHWDFVDGGITGITDSSWARLRTTPKDMPEDENVQGMPTDQDWVFSIVWTNNISTNTTIFECMAESGGDMVKFLGTNNPVGTDPGTFDVNGGDGSGAYVTMASVEIPVGQTQTLSLVYETADGLLDFWIDDTLVAENFASRGGNYDIYRFQIMGGSHSPAGETLDDLKIGLAGEFVPPECGDPGDADDDGDVDDDDLSLLLANWGADVDCSQGEFNDTPPVDDDDLSLLLANWTGALPGAVPEPITLAILGAGALILSRRRK